MRVSVRTSLIALVLVLGATLGAQSWLAMSHIGVVFNSAADLAVNWMPNARTAQRLNYLLAGLRGLEGEMVSTTNPAELGDVAKANAEQVRLLEAQRKDYEDRRAGSEEKVAYDAFSKLWTDYRGQHDQLIALAQKNDMAAAAKIFRGPLSALFDKMNPLVRSIVVANGKGGERSWADAQATYASIMWIMSVSLAIAALIVVAALVFVIRAVTSPITRLTKAMSEVAGGNLTVNVPFADRRNEIGDMARALEMFRTDLTEAERNRAATSAAQERSAEDLKQAREAIARQFQSKMGALADAFVETAGELSNAAGDLSATAEETSRRARVVSGAAEEAAESVQTAAASTEEMSASIREISSQMTKSTEIADTAANEAARTENDVRALSDAASKIGEVVELINNIAGQTNLLALNATIEAARAGEAGRGFAVVASEVKQLAAQTARATDEIGTKIAEIQQATSRTVSSIERIVATVSQIQEISTIIASTIEEQGAATSEIASNTQLASRGAGDVTRNIVGVSDAAELTGRAATRLTGLSGNLNSQAGALQSEVIEFVRQLRAG